MCAHTNQCRQGTTQRHTRQNRLRNRFQKIPQLAHEQRNGCLGAPPTCGVASSPTNSVTNSTIRTWMAGAPCARNHPLRWWSSSRASFFEGTAAAMRREYASILQQQRMQQQEQTAHTTNREADEHILAALRDHASTPCERTMRAQTLHLHALPAPCSLLPAPCSLLRTPPQGAHQGGE